MADFICPFSKRVCNPSCEHWEFDNVSTKTLMGIIPINFTTMDIISGFLTNSLPIPLAFILNEYKKNYDLFHPEHTNTPRGRCLKIEKLNKYHLTNDEDL